MSVRIKFTMLLKRATQHASVLPVLGRSCLFTCTWTPLYIGGGALWFQIVHFKSDTEGYLNVNLCLYQIHTMSTYFIGAQTVAYTMRCVIDSWPVRIINGDQCVSRRPHLESCPYQKPGLMEECYDFQCNTIGAHAERWVLSYGHYASLADFLETLPLIAPSLGTNGTLIQLAPARRGDKSPHSVSQQKNYCRSYCRQSEGSGYN